VTESMKMENKIYSNHDGVAKLYVREGDLADTGKILISIE